MAGVDCVGCVGCVELFGGFQGLSADEQVESSEIDNSLISSVNEQLRHPQAFTARFLDDDFVFRGFEGFAVVT
jgi:hypothetical protein